MMKPCLHLLDGKGIPDKWKMSVVVSIYKGKGDAMSCESYRRIKLL